MRIILKDEVINLGLAGDVVDVADGYARNYLIPRGMAIRASKGAMKEAEAITRARRAREAKTVDEAHQHRATLEARTLRIPARVDDTGTLYGSVGAGDVHRVLKERGHDIDRRRIDLRGSLKQLGTYDVPVRVHPQVTATVVVEIVDVEGKIRPGGAVDVEVEQADVADAAVAAAEDTSTDADVLAEQALDAARDYERRQAEAGATEAGAPAPGTRG